MYCNNLRQFQSIFKSSVKILEIDLQLVKHLLLLANFNSWSLMSCKVY